MILFLGDVHGNFAHVIQIVKTLRPAAIIFLGDIEAQQPFEKEIESILSLTEVYWIHGNHETDSIENYNNVFSSALADRNLHGRVVEIDGLRIAGMGGVFRQTAWYPRANMNDEVIHTSYDDLINADLFKQNGRIVKPIAKLAGNALKHKSTIFYDDWVSLCGQRADILVTHEAPNCHPYGFIGINVLAKSLQVKSSFHGHMHDRIDYSDKFQTIGFNAYGVGFCGVTDQNGHLVLKGDFDDIYDRQYQEKRRSREE